MNRAILITTIALNLIAFAALGVVLRYVGDAPEPARYAFGGAAVAFLLAVAGLTWLCLVTNTRPQYRSYSGPERRSGFGRRAVDREVQDLYDTIAATQPGPGFARKLKEANALDLEPTDEEA